MGEKLRADAFVRLHRDGRQAHRQIRFEPFTLSFIRSVERRGKDDGVGLHSTSLPAGRERRVPHPPSSTRWTPAPAELQEGPDTGGHLGQEPNKRDGGVRIRIWLESDVG